MVSVDSLGGLSTPAGEAPSDWLNTLTTPASRRAAVTLEIVDKTPLAENVVALTLADPGGRRLPDWAPGAHIDLVLPNGVTRQYSLCGDRFDAYNYRVAVRRERGGRGGSAYIHDVLRPGDAAGFGGPRNNFALAPASGYAFVAGGIGITPLLPMIAQAERLGIEWRLIYGGRRRSSMAFLDELTVYGNRVQIAPSDEVGLRSQLPAFLGEPDPGIKVYCCGPTPLLDHMDLAFTEWPKYALHVERFVARDQAAPVRTTPFELILHRSDRSVMVPPEKSVLQAVADAGVEVLSSCRQGTCGTCEVTVLEGTPDHRDSLLTDEERNAADGMYICVSSAASDRLVLDL